MKTNKKLAISIFCKNIVKQFVSVALLLGNIFRNFYEIMRRGKKEKKGN